MNFAAVGSATPVGRVRQQTHFDPTALNEQESRRHSQYRCECERSEGDLQGAAQRVQQAGPVFEQAFGDV
jgi:hypothetical protein